MYAVRALLEDADDPPVGLFSPLLPLSAPPDAEDTEEIIPQKENEGECILTKYRNISRKHPSTIVTAGPRHKMEPIPTW